MKTFKNGYFLGFIFAAILIYMAKQFQIFIPNWISFYLYDLLCMPIVLTTILGMIRHFKKDLYFKIPLFAILSLTMYYAWFFEWLMPKINTRYTADILDVLMYFLGATVFYLAQKQAII